MLLRLSSSGNGVFFLSLICFILPQAIMLFSFFTNIDLSSGAYTVFFLMLLCCFLHKLAKAYKQHLFFILQKNIVQRATKCSANLPAKLYILHLQYVKYILHKSILFCNCKVIDVVHSCQEYSTKRLLNCFLGDSLDSYPLDWTSSFQWVVLSWNSLDLYLPDDTYLFPVGSFVLEFA